MDDSCVEGWHKNGDLILSFMKLMRELQPPTVCLKRFSDTLQLHPESSSDRVVARIEKVRNLAMQLAPHTCIRESIFAEPRIDHHFEYDNVITKGRSAQPSINLVDVGCCMGTDIRKLILDGYPAKNILGLGYEKGFFSLGQMLYDENSSAFQLRHADVLEKSFFANNGDLSSQFDFVHSANVIHLYSAEQQLSFFKALAFMVKPGGVIWGRQVGLSQADILGEHRRPSGKGIRFTAVEFRTLILQATGWADDAIDIEYKHETVAYDELRIARPDKQWVLQWSVCVPMNKEPKERLVELL